MSQEIKDTIKDINEGARKTSLISEGLKDVLHAANEGNKGMIPADVFKLMEKATEDLKAVDFKKATLQIGEEFPDATLLNPRAEEVSLKAALDGKPAIISFYRGAWCPYCNIELAYYNELLGEEENKGIRMFAISPEKPDLETETKDLNFAVCSDTNNKLSKKLNLVFELAKEIQPIYDQFGIDLDASQGNTAKELPVPATFVIDGEGKVVYVDLDVDYTTRPDAAEVVAEYKKLVK